MLVLPPARAGRRQARRGAARLYLRSLRGDRRRVDERAGRSLPERGARPWRRPAPDRRSLPSSGRRAAGSSHHGRGDSMVTARDVKVALVAAVVTLAGAGLMRAQAPPVMGSKIFDWDGLTVAKTKVGERRDVVRAPTATLD